MQITRILLVISAVLAIQVALPTTAVAGEYDHEKDVVYGYKDGMALVMDVFTPTGQLNGAGVIQVVAGGMTSNPRWTHGAVKRPSVQALLEKGYVVFAVAHSSQPKYSADEIVADISRAVRFIRHHAEGFYIHPQRIGITGGSSGGQVSLYAATAPPPPNPEAEDLVDRESSGIQAVVVFFPGTDMANFGSPGTTIVQHFHSLDYRIDAAFDFHRWDNETKRFERVIDPELRLEIFRQNSPIAHVNAGDPPVLLFHGDRDKLVPIQQSRLFVERLKEAGIPHKLIVAEGEGHGWKLPLENQFEEITGWFDRYLLPGVKGAEFNHK
jgi:acetyl esterase/lipase